MVCDGIIDDGINDDEVLSDDARRQVRRDVVDDNVILLHVTVDETNILLMCDVHVVDVLKDDVVVGLFPLDEMKPTGSTFPLMQRNKDDVEVVINDGLTENEVSANEDTEDGQDARGLDVLLLDHDVLHIGDVLLFCVH